MEQNHKVEVGMKKKYLYYSLFIFLCIILFLFFLLEQKNERIINRYSYPGKTEKCRVLEFDQRNKGIIFIAQEIPDFAQYCIENNLKFKEIKSTI